MTGRALMSTLVTRALFENSKGRTRRQVPSVSHDESSRRDRFQV